MGTAIPLYPCEAGIYKPKIQNMRDCRETFNEAPKIGEILAEEFMEPYGLSAYKLVNDIHVPVSRIQDILHGRRKITAGTSNRLGKYSGVSAKFFLNIQNDIDIRNLMIHNSDEPEKISKIEYA